MRASVSGRTSRRAVRDGSQTGRVLLPRIFGPDSRLVADPLPPPFPPSFTPVDSVLVVGGGFLGVEIAAALAAGTFRHCSSVMPHKLCSTNVLRTRRHLTVHPAGFDKRVTLLYASEHVLPSLWPPDVARRYEALLRDRGVELMPSQSIDVITVRPDMPLYVPLLFAPHMFPYNKRVTQWGAPEMCISSTGASSSPIWWSPASAPGRKSTRSGSCGARRPRPTAQAASPSTAASARAPPLQRRARCLFGRRRPPRRCRRLGPMFRNNNSAPPGFVRPPPPPPPPPRPCRVAPCTLLVTPPRSLHDAAALAVRCFIFFKIFFLLAFSQAESARRPTRRRGFATRTRSTRGAAARSSRAPCCHGCGDRAAATAQTRRPRYEG